MASSVNRRIETDLSRVMGKCDPAGLIGPRSTDPIRACGHRPRPQAGHMTASDLPLPTREKPLQAGGHPHMSRRLGFNGRFRRFPAISGQVRFFISYWRIST